MLRNSPITAMSQAVLSQAQGVPVLVGVDESLANSIVVIAFHVGYLLLCNAPLILSDVALPPSLEPLAEPALHQVSFTHRLERSVRGGKPW